MYNKEIGDRIITCLSFHLKMVDKASPHRGGTTYEVNLGQGLWFILKLRQTQPILRKRVLPFTILMHLNALENPENY